MNPTHANTTSPASAAPSPLALFEQLDLILRALVDEHNALLDATAQHRRALATADLSGLGLSITRQNELVGRIANLERQRQDLVAQIAGARPLNPASAPRMSDLTQRAPEYLRVRLTGLAQALRDILDRLHREHQALVLAAQQLSSHMDGILRQVCRTLSHAGTYARSGSVEAGVQVVSTLDVRS